MLSSNRIGIPGRGGGGASIPAWVRQSLIVYDSGLGVTLNGSTVSDWANQGRGGSSYDLSQATASIQPTFTASDPDVNGRPSLGIGSIGGFTRLIGNPSFAQVDFLSDGSAASVAAVYIADTATFATGLNTSSPDGYQHIVTRGAPDNGMPRTVIFGVSGNAIVDATATVATGNAFVVSTTSDGATLKQWVDGADMQSAAYPATPGVAGKFQIGANAQIRVMAVVVDDREWSTVERQAIESWLHGRFINSLPQFLRRNLMVFESSLGVTLNGSTVSDWANQGYGGSSYDLAQATAAEQPTYTQSDAVFANKPVLTFDGSDDYMAGATQALIRFLHEGNGATVYTVASPASGASASQALVATKDSGVGEPGYRLQVSTSGTVNCIIRNVGSVIVSLTSTSDVTGAANLISQRYEEGFAPESELYVGGTQETTANSTGAPSANDPQSMLYVGRTSNNTAHLDGGLASVIIDNTRHDDTLRAQHEAWLLGRYGI